MDTPAKTETPPPADGPQGLMKTRLNQLPAGKRQELEFVVEVLREGFAEAIAHRTMPRFKNGRILARRADHPTAGLVREICEERIAALAKAASA